MSEPLSRDVFHMVIDPMRADIQELVQIVRQQNGRVGTVETKVAILEDRSPGRAASVWGGVAGLVGSALASFFSGHK